MPRTWTSYQNCPVSARTYLPYITFTDLDNLVSASVDDEVGFDVRGFGMRLDQEFLGVDVEGDGLEVVDD
jgi:hypothetical protein